MKDEVSSGLDDWSGESQRIVKVHIDFKFALLLGQGVDHESLYWLFLGLLETTWSFQILKFAALDHWVLWELMGLVTNLGFIDQKS